MIKTIKNLSAFFEQNPQIKKIAVVGKMASGKNFICSKLEEFGFKSVDADILVHKSIENSSSKILETFTPFAKQENINLLNSDGTIARRELGKLLFKFPNLMEKQEQIVYPIVKNMMREFISSNEKSIINATVLYKIPEFISECDVVFYIKASFLKRFIRAKKRDNLSCKQILRRFYSQRNLFKKYKQICKNLMIIKN